MTQRIGGLDLQLPATGAGAGAQVPPAGPDLTDGQAATVAPGPEVQITQTASRLAELEQSMRAQPAVDAARVAAARQALASGSYRADPDRIAAGLLQIEQTLQG
jgi:negative regulator of flagellin synthesis FlgM